MGGDASRPACCAKASRGTDREGIALAASRGQANGRRFPYPILSLGHRARIASADLRACRRALAQVRHAPFFLQFDRVETNGGVMLACDDRNCAAQAFRQQVADALSNVFGHLPGDATDGRPTLNSYGDTLDRPLAQHVLWRVEEFLLVERADDGASPVELGRWPLQGA